MTSAATSPFSMMLFVVGRDDTSAAQIRAFQSLLAENDQPEDAMTVVDLSDDPAQALAYDILAIPTVIRTVPKPPVRIIGEMTDRKKVWSLLSA